jgi:VanZ family protein
MVRTPSRPVDRLRRALFSRPARRAWAATLSLLTVTVLFLALRPGSGGPTLGWDKANHALAFACLAFSGLFALRERRRAPLWVAIGLLALGGLIELVQLHVPGRSAEWADLLADAVGIGLGLAAALVLAARLDRRRQPRGPTG